MKGLLNLVLAVIAGIGVAQACDFKIEPATRPRFYRSGGWELPPLERGKFSGPVRFGGPGSPSAALEFGPGPILGLTTRRITLDATHEGRLLFEIPRQEFERDGQHGVMSSQLMVVQGIWRYDVEGKVVAYSIGLTPVEAHRENGKWRVDGEVGCIFYGTFLDDKGDGVFRVLAPGWMKPELEPDWVLDRKKNPL